MEVVEGVRMIAKAPRLQHDMIDLSEIYYGTVDLPTVFGSYIYVGAYGRALALNCINLAAGPLCKYI